MSLPIPNERAVKAFQSLYRREFGLALTDEQAQDWATRVLQVYYLKRQAALPSNHNAPRSIRS